jgi:hypothetical protein
MARALPRDLTVTVDPSTGSNTTVVVCGMCGWRTLVIGDRLAGLTAGAAHEHTHHRELAALTASATRRLAALTWYRTHRPPP